MTGCSNVLALSQLVLPSFLGFSVSSSPRCANPRLSTEAIDLAVRSRTFWSQVRLVLEVSEQAEFAGRWTEGCPCHEAELLQFAAEQAELRVVLHKHGCARRMSRHTTQRLKAALDCPWRCCRAAELASGRFLKRLRGRTSL